MRLFLDASVIFAAALSPKGASREIIRLALQGDIQIVLSIVVIEEARRNLARKAPEALPLFEAFLEALPYECVDPSAAEVRAMAAHVVLKDAPIVAAAHRARVDMLVSLDRKHLVGVPGLEQVARTKIVLPADALREIRNSLQH